MYIEEFYAQQNIDNCHLLTGVDNDSARTLYESLGYEFEDDVYYEKSFNDNLNIGKANK